MSHTETYATAPSTQLTITRSGPPTASPVYIFLHFWGGSSQTWSKVLAHLPPTLQTIAVDFRGWGLSTGPSDPTAYSIANLASDIESLIQQLHIPSYVLVGHSMGGKVAQLVAGRNYIPGLKGMVLIAPAPPTPLVLPEDMRLQQVMAYETRDAAEFVVRNVLTASKIDEQDVKNLVDDMMRGNEFAKKAWPEYGMGEDVREQAKKISVPVVIVAGELDRVETVERVKGEVLPNIKRAEMVVIEGVGHLLPIEAPSKVAQAVTELMVLA